MDHHPPLRSFGRIKSRTIKPRQAALMDSLLPRIRAPQTPFDPQALAPEAAEVWLEIGFGGGEHMAAQADRAREVLILGAEPFQNGVASALRHIDERGLTNVRLQDGDVRDLIANLPDACLTRIFILFPDPWPKARHNKRRLVNAELLVELARVLKPGGRLRFATDWADYADWTLERVLRNPAFRWPATQASDWRVPPADHITTRYEEKRLGDCAPVFLDFVRV
ncbi:tRNA (guanosine(46)-N7)-methyltransferase TrmB [Phenylobacterium aquaticum]|uniref:tRNA (guanosine(46)-N7)-methyltransferase TrmB n=1 Tax=Phenylobacterium aquaticum TaxID=1763816 RepID=UPI001F5CA984|nr:tRNA (guanosine(46)-N7)-methyltransferase TrmB [Phenylobacterium aquaticum]MCI3135554.1 tRNA (guanosine(46)-N7)-methyltransferase TrmB [Phenylobacterium aquaticum]